jgi:hypothetical protein
MDWDLPDDAKLVCKVTEDVFFFTIFIPFTWESRFYHVNLQVECIKNTY